MNNEMITELNAAPAVYQSFQPAINDQGTYYPVYDNERAGRYVDEIIAAVKDDRMITKRAISADIAETARVQNQNESVIEACKRELRRQDLSAESRLRILEIMDQTAASSATESAASREFRKSQLEHMHKLPWQLLGGGLLVGCLALGGRVLLRAR